MYDVFEKLCKERGVTAYRVCKATGLTTASISNWKAGRYTPKMDKMKKIADFFGVSVNYLMTGEVEDGYYENDDTAAIAQEIFDNPDLRVLFDAARDANPDDLKTTYDMLMALKRKEKGDDYDPA